MSSTVRTSVVPFVVEASGSGVAQHLVAPGANTHEFDTDAYPAFGGQDAAPSPLLYALGALTSCNQVTASLVAKDLGITLGEFTFRIQGDLDTAVFVTGAEGNANFDKVVVDVTVQTDADEPTFEKFASEVERRCPVSQLYIRSGLDFHSDWNRVDLP